MRCDTLAQYSLSPLISTPQNSQALSPLAWYTQWSGVLETTQDQGTLLLKTPTL